MKVYAELEIRQTDFDELAPDACEIATYLAGMVCCDGPWYAVKDVTVWMSLEELLDDCKEVT